MTKEQEVIEHIEKRIKICNENADICDDNDFDEEATYLREESYMLETVLNMLKEKDKKIEKKDKIIDLMANSFAEEGFYSEHCQTLIDNEICPNDCDKCVKQYFEKLAKEEGE